MKRSLKSLFLAGATAWSIGQCQMLPAGDLANIELVQTKVLDLPWVAVDLQAPPDGTNRLFALSVTGEIRIIDLDAKTVSATPFMQVPDVYLNAGERAAYSLAFHPNFASNGYFYVHHAIAVNFVTAGNRIARFTATNATTADPGSRVVLFDTEKYSNFHFGGTIRFGPDGFLYIAIGDDERIGGNPQSNWDPMGKILRVDVDNPAGGNNYGIPAGNPIGTGEGVSEVLMKGLRNPWRFSFDRQTGDLWVADVGEDDWEEINRVADYASPESPLDFGWPYYEGNTVFDAFVNMPTNYQAPVHVYEHSGAFAYRSVTGGYVYRGSRFPRMKGVYFFGDFMTASISGLEDGGVSWSARELADYDNSKGVYTFGEDRDGELYVAVTLGIYHLGDTVEVAPEILLVTDVGVNGSGFFFMTVQGTDGAQLQLRRRDELGAGSWSDIGAPVSATAGLVTLTDTEETVPAVGKPNRFYSVVQTGP